MSSAISAQAVGVVCNCGQGYLTAAHRESHREDWFQKHKAAGHKPKRVTQAEYEERYGR